MADYNDRSTSAPSNSGIVSDSMGGTVNPDQQSSTFDQNTSTSGADSNFGPSAGYGNNVDKNFAETGEKKGFMSKVKDKLMPSGPGETDASGDMTQNAASHAMHEGKDVRSSQANADINRE